VEKFDHFLLLERVYLLKMIKENMRKGERKNKKRRKKGKERKKKKRRKRKC